MSTHISQATISDQAKQAEGLSRPVAQSSRTPAGSAKTETDAPDSGTAIEGVAGDGVATGGPALSRMNKLFAQFVGFIGMGYGLSFIIHLIILMLCSIIIFEEVGGSPLVVTISSVAGEQVGVEDFLDAQIEVPEIEETADLPVDPSLLENPMADASLLKDGLGETASSKGGSDDGAQGLAIPIPSSGIVVTKGSFTAWTVPEDPRPGQIYKIVIQVQLPENIERYKSSDLSGMVRGSDRYQQRIPWDWRQSLPTLKLGPDNKLVRLKRNGRLPINKHRVQLVIQVPGAKALVRDTIVIRSKLLKEKQQLKIVF